MFNGLDQSLENLCDEPTKKSRQKDRASEEFVQVVYSRRLHGGVVCLCPRALSSTAVGTCQPTLYRNVAAGTHSSGQFAG